jgi:hypothetical protein
VGHGLDTNSLAVVPIGGGDDLAAVDDLNAARPQLPRGYVLKW